MANKDIIKIKTDKGTRVIRRDLQRNPNIRAIQKRLDKEKADKKKSSSSKSKSSSPSKPTPTPKQESTISNRDLIKQVEGKPIQEARGIIETERIKRKEKPLPAGFSISIQPSGKDKLKQRLQRGALENVARDKFGVSGLESRGQKERVKGTLTASKSNLATQPLLNVGRAIETKGFRERNPFIKIGGEALKIPSGVEKVVRDPFSVGSAVAVGAGITLLATKNPAAAQAVGAGIGSIFIGKLAVDIGTGKTEAGLAIGEAVGFGAIAGGASKLVPRKIIISKALEKPIIEYKGGAIRVTKTDSLKLPKRQYKKTIELDKGFKLKGVGENFRETVTQKPNTNKITSLVTKKVFGKPTKVKTVIQKGQGTTEVIFNKKKIAKFDFTPESPLLSTEKVTRSKVKQLSRSELGLKIETETISRESKAFKRTKQGDINLKFVSGDIKTTKSVVIEPREELIGNELLKTKGKRFLQFDKGLIEQKKIKFVDYVVKPDQTTIEIGPKGKSTFTKPSTVKTTITQKGKTAIRGYYVPKQKPTFKKLLKSKKGSAITKPKTEKIKVNIPADFKTVPKSKLPLFNIPSPKPKNVTVPIFSKIKKKGKEKHRLKEKTTPQFKVIPDAKTINKTLPRFESELISHPTTKSKSAIVSKPLIDTSLVQTPKPSQIIRQKRISKVSPRSKLAKVTKLRNIFTPQVPTSTRYSSIGVPNRVTPPPPPPPPKLGLFFPKFKEEKKSKSKSKKSKSKDFVLKTPSLEANIFNIKSKKIPEYVYKTGLNLRPIKIK